MALAVVSDFGPKWFLICTGLTILGLCLPLPGTPRVDLEQSGWGPLTVERNDVWWVNRVFRSGTLTISASVSGSGASSRALLLKSPDLDAAGVEELLGVGCNRSSSTCTIGKLSLRKRKCWQGVLLAKPGEPPTGLEGFICDGKPGAQTSDGAVGDAVGFCQADTDCRPPSLCACERSDCSIRPDFFFVSGRSQNSCISAEVRRETRLPIRTRDGGWTVETDKRGRVFRSSEEAREVIENEEVRRRVW